MIVLVKTSIGLFFSIALSSSKIRGELYPKTIGSLAKTYFVVGSRIKLFSILILKRPYILSERVLSYSYEGKCSKVSKTLAEDKKSSRQFDLLII